MSDGDLNLTQDRPRDRIFHCPRCVQAYSMDRWTITDSGDDHPIASWYDCATIRCPGGHERHADLAIVTYEKPRTGPPATLGSGKGSPTRPFWTWLASLSSKLENQSNSR